MRLGKPLTARLMPVPGKKAGELTGFDFAFFANGRILDLPAAPLTGLLAGPAVRLVTLTGAGGMGSAAAYHLARAGVRTLLIEQGDLASGASGANFGNIQVEDAEFGLSLELTLRSYARFAELGAELDFRAPLGWESVGDLAARRVVVLQDLEEL